VALVDALGNLARFVLLPGQRHDSVGIEPLVEAIEFEARLADKAFDLDWLRAELTDRGAQAVIPAKVNRQQAIACDLHLDRWRHLTENFFCKLQAFRRIATRYDKTDKRFSAMIHLVGAALAIR